MNHHDFLSSRKERWLWFHKSYLLGWKVRLAADILLSCELSLCLLLWGKVFGGLQCSLFLKLQCGRQELKCQYPSSTQYPTPGWVSMEPVSQRQSHFNKCYDLPKYGLQGIIIITCITKTKSLSREGFHLLHRFLTWPKSSSHQLQCNLPLFLV